MFTENITEDKIAVTRSDASRLAFDVKRDHSEFSALDHTVPAICFVCLGLCYNGECCYETPVQIVGNKFYWHSLPETPLAEICERYVPKALGKKRVLSPALEYA